MPTSTTTEPESVKNTWFKSPGRESVIFAPSGWLVHVETRQASHEVIFQLVHHRRLNMRVTIA